MAFKLLPLALDHGPRDAMARLVFFTLCERADGTTGECWPSYGDIMERTGLSRSTVVRRLRALERDGWIARKQRFNSSTLFRVNIQRLRDREQEREKRLRQVPEGFEPFPEELAAQAAENKGEAQADRSKAHADRSEAHRAATNLSLNQPINLSDLSDFQKSCARRGSSFLHGGRMVHGAELYRLSEAANAELSDSDGLAEKGRS